MFVNKRRNFLWFIKKLVNKITEYLIINKKLMY